MKKKLIILVGAGILLTSGSALGVEAIVFDIFGIKINQSKSTFNNLDKFNCYAEESLHFNETCSADLTIENHQARMLLSLDDGLVVDLNATFEHADKTFFEAAVQAAIEQPD